MAELTSPDQPITLTHFIINVGGGPTEDKPEVVLEAPSDPNRVSAFLNLRVADSPAQDG